MSVRIRATLIACLVSILLATTRLGAQAAPTGTTLYFPHIANGDTGNGVWTTEFTFTNNSSSTATGQLSLFSDSGASLVLTTNLGPGGVFNLTIPPGGGFSVQTNGAGAVVGGYARATFNHAVIGSATFALSTTAAGELVSVGVLSTYPADTFRSPADFQSGVAFANVDSRITISVTIQAFDLNGNLAGSVFLTLAPGQHVANNLNKLIIPALPAMFVGSIKIQASNPSMIALAIGVKPNTISNLFVSYSLPAIAYNEPAASYSGNCILTSGPHAGTPATVGLADVEVFDSGLFTATLDFTFQGTLYTAPLLANIDPFGLLYSFYFQIPELPDLGRAVAQRQPDGSLIGFAVDFGTGDAGTFNISPQ